MHPILEFPDPDDSDLTGEMVQLRRLSTADEGDLAEAGANHEMFRWFVDGWIIQE